MATMTINPSGWTYVSNLDKNADHSFASRAYTGRYFKNAVENETAWNNISQINVPAQGAIFKFVKPNALKYAKITSVKLTWYLDGYASPSGGETYFTDYGQAYVASYGSDYPLSAITWNSYKQNGVTGDFLSIGSGAQVTKPISRTADITAMYSAALSSTDFTIVIAAANGTSVDAYSSFYSWVDPTQTYLTVTYEPGTQPAPSPLYPKDQTLIEADTTLFTWQFNSETEAVQTAAQLQYKLASDQTYTTVNLTQPDYSYTLNSRLAPGSYQWRVKVTNDAGETSDFSEVANFNIVGRPAAPIINEPANKALTEISWNTTNQQSCEIILADQGGRELYHETLASQENFYRPNFFLKGAYLFSVRVMNDSMMWSDWAQRAFTISAAGPAAATISLVSAAGTPSVRLTYSIPSGINGALMRSCEGKEKIITNLEPMATGYVDDTVASDVVYTYWIRTYVDGYTDSQKLEAKVSFDGAIFSAADTILHLMTSDEQFLQHSEDISREFAILKLSGREYPLIERGEFTSVEFSRKFYVTAAEKKILDKLCKEESVYYRDNKENAFPAGIKQVHYDSYMADGYLATISLVRLHEEEVVVNV